jgi:hypothetical protein
VAYAQQKLVMLTIARVDRIPYFFHTKCQFAISTSVCVAGKVRKNAHFCMFAIRLEHNHVPNSTVEIANAESWFVKDDEKRGREENVGFVPASPQVDFSNFIKYCY